MADIKLVIKIDEEYLEDIKERVKDGDIDYEPWVAIANGTPLPKHGRLIDEVKEELERQRKWLFKAGYNAYNIDVAFDTIKSLLKEVEGDK